MPGDILVVAEHLRGQLAGIALEMVAAARELAGPLQAGVEVLLMGHGVEPLASGIAGADRILVVDDPRLEHFTPQTHAAVTAAVAQERGSRLILVGNTSEGMDVAPAVAARLELPLVAYCRSLRVEGDEVVATSSLYGGKIEATVPVPERAVLTVLSGIARAEAARADGAAPVVRIPMPPGAADAARVRFKALHEPEAGDVDITRMDVLVSVGRGIGDAANIPLAEEVARLLGGAVSASRPVVDNGWLPKTRQVGKSGLTVKPRCYIAAGISGAPEHLEGMRDASLIIAINTDPQAPIFDVAHYGAVADVLEVLPALADRLRER